MKKEAIVGAIILALVMIMNVITQKYTINVTNEISECVIEACNEIKQGNVDEAKEKVEYTISRWEKLKGKLELYIEHTELEKLEMYILDGKNYMDTEEYTMAYESLNTSDFIAKHIQEKYKFCLKNIF